MKNINFISAIILILSFFGCNNEEPCYDKPLPTLTIDKAFDCPRTSSQMVIDLNEDFMIIRDQMTFDSLVSVYCNPQIDFNTYDLVIGKKQLTSADGLIDYELVDRCDQLNHDLKVHIQLTELQSAPNITYHCLIPKLEPNQSVNIKVTTYHL